MDLKEFYSAENGVLTRMRPKEMHQLIGEITTLFLASHVHRNYLINDIGAMFLPPLHLNQFRIYRDGQGAPVGLITWAWLTRDVEKGYVTGEYNLKPEDWNAGDQLWFTDFLAPYGHMARIAQDMKHNVFPDEVAKAIRLDHKGRVRGVRLHHGANRVKDAAQIKAGMKELPEPLSAGGEG